MFREAVIWMANDGNLGDQGESDFRQSKGSIYCHSIHILPRSESELTNISENITYMLVAPEFFFKKIGRAC